MLKNFLKTVQFALLQTMMREEMILFLEKMLIILFVGGMDGLKNI
jgi:hypothetical protein